MDSEHEVDHGTPAILLVEDNESDYLLLLRQVGKLLTPRQCGRAGNHAELNATLDQPWDLIITDYHLTDIEGEALLAVIAAAQPQTPCLVLSGSARGLERLYAHANVFRVVEKGDNGALRSALTGHWHKPV